jgi:hypothetical protein
VKKLTNSEKEWLKELASLPENEFEAEVKKAIDIMRYANKIQKDKEYSETHNSKKHKAALARLFKEFQEMEKPKT